MEKKFDAERYGHISRQLDMLKGRAANGELNTIAFEKLLSSANKGRPIFVQRTDCVLPSYCTKVEDDLKTCRYCDVGYPSTVEDLRPFYSTKPRKEWLDGKYYTSCQYICYLVYFLRKTSFEEAVEQISHTGFVLSNLNIFLAAQRRGLHTYRASGDSHIIVAGHDLKKRDGYVVSTSRKDLLVFKGNKIYVEPLEREQKDRPDPYNEYYLVHEAIVL